MCRLQDDDSCLIRSEAFHSPRETHTKALIIQYGLLGTGRSDIPYDRMRMVCKTRPVIEIAGGRRVMVLWRPTGPEELELVRASGWRRWPPRLPDQPIFYPVLDEEYAVTIARDWNVPASGVGYVTRFAVDAGFAGRYPVRQVGGRTILELWVPAKELEEFNDHIIGMIEVVHEFR